MRQCAHTPTQEDPYSTNLQYAPGVGTPFATSWVSHPMPGTAHTHATFSVCFFFFRSRGGSDAPAKDLRTFDDEDGDEADTMVKVWLVVGLLQDIPSGVGDCADVRFIHFLCLMLAPAR